MLKLSHFSAFIFDLDGLVLDTESTYFRAWQAAAKTLGHHLSDAFCLSLSGLHYQAVEQKLLVLCGDDFDLEQFNLCAGNKWREQVSMTGIELKPGLIELLAFIKQHPLAFCIATNSSRFNALECLEFAGLKDVFTHIISRDDVPCGKPEPDIFLKAAERLNVDIKCCMVLEDSHTGIVAASRAGAYSVFVPSSPQVDPLTLDLCDLTVNDLFGVLAEFT